MVVLLTPLFCINSKLAGLFCLGTVTLFNEIHMFFKKEIYYPLCNSMLLLDLIVIFFNLITLKRVIIYRF